MNTYLDFEQEIKELDEKITSLRQAAGDAPTAAQTTALMTAEKALVSAIQKAYAKLTPWQTVQVARHPERPSIRDYIPGICSEFLELHGDRCYGDDKALIGGMATIEGRRVMLIGHQKGRNVDDNVKMNFGMASPDGYRKALRLMKLAEAYGLPVVSFIDTPGAYPGADAEARGQAEAIARNLTEMAVLKSPILVVVTGEGGSGGALGIGVGDTMLMLENSVYSVISPEGCASILWRDGTKAPEAAEALKITSDSLFKLGIVDAIIPEPVGAAHRNHATVIKAVKAAVINNLDKLTGISTAKLVSRRYEKYSNIGRLFRK